MTPPVGEAEGDPNDDLGYLLRTYQETHPDGSSLDYTLTERTVPTTANRRRCDRAIWAGLGRLPDPRERRPHDRRRIRLRGPPRRDPGLRAEAGRIPRRRRPRVLDHRPVPAYHDSLPATARTDAEQVVAEGETYQTDLAPRVRPAPRPPSGPGRSLEEGPPQAHPASPPPEGLMVKIRRAYEGLFLGLFLFFLLITDLRYLKGWPVSLFLEATPLVAVTTALTTHTIYRNLVWGLVVIAVTMMLGRVWCNWMCPFGILHHIFGYIGNTPEHQAAHRGQPLQEDLRDQVLHPRRDARDGRLWVVPTILDAPGQIVEAYRADGLLVTALVARRSRPRASPAARTLRSERITHRPTGRYPARSSGLARIAPFAAVHHGRRRRRPRSTSGATARSRSACSTRSP